MNKIHSSMTSMAARLCLQSFRGLSIGAPKLTSSALKSQSKSLFHTIASAGHNGQVMRLTNQLRMPNATNIPLYMTNVTRGFKNKKSPKPLKTKKAAAKRIIRTASGKLKHGHGGKAHLNTKKSRVRLSRLNKKGFLTGVMFKNMNKLILTGK